MEPSQGSNSFNTLTPGYYPIYSQGESLPTSNESSTSPSLKERVAKVSLAQLQLNVEIAEERLNMAAFPDAATFAAENDQEAKTIKAQIEIWIKNEEDINAKIKKNLFDQNQSISRIFKIEEEIEEYSETDLNSLKEKYGLLLYEAIPLKVEIQNLEYVKSKYKKTIAEYNKLQPLRDSLYKEACICSSTQEPFTQSITEILASINQLEKNINEKTSKKEFFSPQELSAIDIKQVQNKINYNSDLLISIKLKLIECNKIAEAIKNAYLELLPLRFSVAANTKEYLNLQTQLENITAEKSKLEQTYKKFVSEKSQEFLMASISSLFEKEKMKIAFNDLHVTLASNFRKAQQELYAYESKLSSLTLEKYGLQPPDLKAKLNASLIRFEPPSMSFD